ncbi:MAG: type I pantothenate kinase [Myxococcales bacterium]|nr:type I pantothenate kinase [Myxococcales bacterium]
MPQRSHDPRPDETLSPYRTYSRAEWAALREHETQPLTADEVARLRSLNDPISLEEVGEIYLPLSRLLSLHVTATQSLFAATQRFMRSPDAVKTPFILGVAGSVAVGKSTTARVLQALLSRWPGSPRVSLITTDGFLLPNTALAERGLMARKGFPESYDTRGLLRFLSDIKAGRRRVEAPVYSHLSYDVIPGASVVLDEPDIVIVEGLNVLQPARLPPDGEHVPFVSDFFDFSVYLDAEESLLRTWYVERFMRLRETAFRDPRSYFVKYAALGEAEALDVAGSVWDAINLVNLRENIRPTRQRAKLILRKGQDHLIDEVSLRRI